MTADKLTFGLTPRVDRCAVARPAEHPTAPRWDVYLGDGAKFADTPTPWTLPKQRGRGDDGLNATSGEGTEDGDNRWTLVDVDGDAKPELVITAQQVSFEMKAFGHPSAAHWEVYPNTGTGFGAMATFTIPRGGTGSGGFHSLASPGADVPGDDAWSTVDIDGDGKIDLVITGEFTAGATPATYGLGRVANDPHWMVYRGTGTGFPNEGAKWALPSGGLREVGFNNVSGVGAKSGDESWTLLDLTGDKQPELVRLSNTIEDPRSPGSAFTIPRVEGWGASTRWQVHTNVP